ncbi:MAG TPA: NADH-quinone oxidoreductase subunit NuoK, partial [Candidatus Limnocylindrales bacterium]
MIRVFLGAALTAIFVVGLGLIALAAGGSRSLNSYLVLSGLLFSIGMFGFLARRNAISMLMSIELMLNAVNLAIVAFGSFIQKLTADGSVIAI